MELSCAWSAIHAHRIHTSPHAFSRRHRAATYARIEVGNVIDFSISTAKQKVVIIYTNVRKRVLLATSFTPKARFTFRSLVLPHFLAAVSREAFFIARMALLSHDIIAAKLVASFMRYRRKCFTLCLLANMVSACWHFKQLSKLCIETLAG